MHRAVNSLYFFFFALALLSLSACAISPHRYQGAHTLGQGHWRVSAAPEIALGAGFFWNGLLDEEMQDELDQYAERHPEYEEDVEGAAANIGTGLAAVIGGYMPTAELIVDYGVRDSIDLEVSTLGFLSYGANAKFRLAQFGTGGALAVAPGLNAQYILNNGTGRSDETKYQMHLQGYVLAPAVPLIFGWRWEHVDLFLSGGYTYYYISLDRRWIIKQFDPDFDETVSLRRGIHTGTVTLGATFRWGPLVLTPEIVTLFFEGSSVPYFPMPGLALGLQW